MADGPYDLVDSLSFYPDVGSPGRGLLSSYIGQNGTNNLEMESIPSAPGRQVVRTRGSSTNTGGFGFALPIPVPTFAFQIWTRLAVAANLNDAPFIMVQANTSGSTFTHCGLRVNNDGTLQAVRGYNAATIGSPGAGAVMLDATWHCVDGVIDIHATAGSVKVWLDDVQVLDLTGVNTKGQSPADAYSVFFQGTQGAVDIHWRDLIYRAGADRIGRKVIEIAKPTADTASKDWSASTGSSNFTMVDEDPVDPSDYVSADAVGSLDLYGASPALPAGAVIRTVQVRSSIRKAGTDERNVNLAVKDGATGNNGANTLLQGIDYQRVVRPMFVNPVTGLAWTPAQVNGLLFGPRVAS